MTVGGQAASVVKTEPQAVRFQMPQVAGAPGSLHQVLVASSGGRSAPPLEIYLGRLPLVSAVEPARGVAGDLVRVRGAGFTAETTHVSFDGQPALVAAGSTSELLVVVPPSPRRAGGGARSRSWSRRQAAPRRTAPGFTLQRLVEGAWVPRFVAGAPGEGGTAGQATVGTELAPVLLLSSKDESRSTGERALSVAKALDAAVDRARVGQAVAFEAREEPEICVALVGAPDLLLKVLPQDAAAYEAPLGLPEPRGAADAVGARAALGGAADRHRGDRDERGEAHRHRGPRSALEPRVHAAAGGAAVAVRQRCRERARGGRVAGPEAEAARGGAAGSLS